MAPVTLNALAASDAVVWANFGPAVNAAPVAAVAAVNAAPVAARIRAVLLFGSDPPLYFLFIVRLFFLRVFLMLVRLLERLFVRKVVPLLCLFL